jgi:serine/threonine-protein kinase
VQQDRSRSRNSGYHVPPGTRLNGVYEIDSLIGTGGMGEVYKGHAIQTGDPVAIKMIRPDLAENDSVLTLFRKEASALHELYHEAIVRYFVFSIDPTLDRPYLAMEYMDGPSLADILKNGPLPLETVRVLQRRLAAGLQAAHEIGIIHRDVSPDNIILPGGNPKRAKIIDFGIARSNSVHGTVIGSGFAGKFNYVSPEQLGLFGGEVTAKSDMYSLGLVLAESIIGQALDMGGSQVQVVQKRQTVPDLSGVHPEIRPLIHHMLQPDPDDRPDSMAAVASWEPVAEKKASRRWVAWTFGGLATAGVAAAAMFFVMPQLSDWRPPIAVPGPSPTPPRPAPSSPDRPSASRAPDLTPPTTPSQPPEVSLPPAPAPAPQPLPPEPVRPPAPQVETLTKAEQIRRYITEYSGGDCFFVTPLQVSDRIASVEAYGASPAPFQAFDASFTQLFGFEAQIALRQVTTAQCPLVGFLARTAAERRAAPTLDIGSFNLRNGQPLSGTVRWQAGQHVEVLLVSDDGYAYNLSAFSRRTADSLSFNSQMNAQGPKGSRPQVVVAIASARPLPSLTSGQPVAASTLFPRVLTEAAETGQSLNVSVKYFKLEG